MSDIKTFVESSETRTIITTTMTTFSTASRSTTYTGSTFAAFEYGTAFQNKDDPGCFDETGVRIPP